MIKNYKNVTIITWMILIVYLLMFSCGYLQVVDEWVYQQLSQIISPTMTIVMKTITFFGSWIAVVAICCVSCLVNKRRGLFISKHVAIVYILNNIMKWIVQRPRPSILPLVAETSYSFPSGHSMVSFALFMMLAYYLWGRCRLLAYVSALMPILIGISRVYLGVHYTTDVLGGFLASMTYLLSLYVYKQLTSGKSFSKMNLNTEKRKSK